MKILIARLYLITTNSKNMTKLNFTKILKIVSIEDQQLITKIAKRAIKYYKLHFKKKIDLHELEMDLIAVHGHCCKLNLNKLLEFDDFNFAHDINGIKNSIDRRTIELKNCFLPLCAR